ncbi:MAG: TatD family hydrolase [Candidatus Colwellbacteria bacterium]|jgi:TatD DNase family protein|nr:TatD family hydrolase [Candidatus Colwellbacteria bacterium]MCK9497614.1 TatD family hydrolase [Candidatus Colwellbacteria bacterium]MDD3752496.1 TatD family hydrolase [Candidatus Colwellbacteria bacterium]MDD4818897.1 TatD family hydrolase [Candidatus Colwellbacteria bacterium]
MTKEPKYIDTHAHLQFSNFDGDREEVIERTLNFGMWVVNSGSNSKTSKKAIEIAENYKEGVYATVGIHPSHAKISNLKSQNLKLQPKTDNLDNNEITEESGVEDFDGEKMRMLAAHPKCVAIGECGLEYFSSGEAIDNSNEQEEMFLQHIELASEIKKPLVIHCRNAYADTIRILKENRNKLLDDRPGVMHFFSGTEGDMYELLDLGFIFSFGGAITFSPKKGQEDIAGLVYKAPFEAIMLETDCPFVAPVPYRGKRNEPLYAIETAKKIAEIKNMSLEEVADITTGNALRFFAIGDATR